jgi:hypothetical protein
MDLCPVPFPECCLLRPSSNVFLHRRNLANNLMSLALFDTLLRTARADVHPLHSSPPVFLSLLLPGPFHPST